MIPTESPSLASPARPGVSRSRPAGVLHPAFAERARLWAALAATASESLRLRGRPLARSAANGRLLRARAELAARSEGMAAGSRPRTRRRS